MRIITATFMCLGFRSLSRTDRSTLEQARAEIEKTLTEAKIESEMDAFLDTARERAEIVMLSSV